MANPACRNCNGSGRVGSADDNWACPQCGGSGVIEIVHRQGCSWYRKPKPPGSRPCFCGSEALPPDEMPFTEKLKRRAKAIESDVISSILLFDAADALWDAEQQLTRLRAEVASLTGQLEHEKCETKTVRAYWVRELAEERDRCDILRAEVASLRGLREPHETPMTPPQETNEAEQWRKSRVETRDGIQDRLESALLNDIFIVTAADALEADDKGTLCAIHLMLKYRDLRHADELATLRQSLAALTPLDLQPLKDACDRNWTDETPEQVVTIAANAIYWRQREIEDLRERVATLTREKETLQAEIDRLADVELGLRQEIAHRESDVSFTRAYRQLIAARLNVPLPQAEGNVWEAVLAALDDHQRLLGEHERLTAALAFLTTRPSRLEPNDEDPRYIMGWNNAGVNVANYAREKLEQASISPGDSVKPSNIDAIDKAAIERTMLTRVSTAFAEWLDEDGCNNEEAPALVQEFMQKVAPDAPEKLELASAAIERQAISETLDKVRDAIDAMNLTTDQSEKFKYGWDCGLADVRKQLFALRPSAPAGTMTDAGEPFTVECVDGGHGFHLMVAGERCVCGATEIHEYPSDNPNVRSFRVVQATTKPAGTEP